MGCPRGGYDANLLANAQTTQQIDIALRIVASHVVEKTATTTYHPQQTAAAGIIFRVTAHVFSQVIDAAGQNSDLHRRRSGIFIACPEISNRLCLRLFSDSHWSINFLQTSCVIESRYARHDSTVLTLCIFKPYTLVPTAAVASWLTRTA